MFIDHHSVNVVFAFGTKVITQYELYTGDPYHGDATECGTYQMKNRLEIDKIML